MSTETATSIIDRFNNIRWHDSKLLGVSCYRGSSGEAVKISLQLLDEYGTFRPVDLVLQESTYVAIEVDLEAKCQCSDDISEAQCSTESKWQRMLAEQHPYDNFGGYLHFRISLIPPGGTINVLARDFSFAPSA